MHLERGDIGGLGGLLGLQQDGAERGQKSIKGATRRVAKATRAPPRTG